MSTCFRLFAVFLLSLSLVGLAEFSQAQVTKIDGSKNAVAWAVHPEMGRIFAADKIASKVFEYDGATGKQIRVFDVAAEPEHLLIKDDILCVGCTKSQRIVFISLESNSVAGELELKGKGPYGFFCSQVQNPFVYCSCQQGDSWTDGAILQIDVRKRSVRKQTNIQNWGQRHPINVAMSADGKWIIPDARGSSSPSGADLMEVDENAFKFVQHFDYHKSFGQIMAGPSSRFWTLGENLYSLDIRNAIRSYVGTPVAIHPSYDLVAGFNETGLVMQQFSDAKKLADISFPKEETPESESKKPRRRSSSKKRADQKINVCLQFDLKNQTVVAARLENAYIVSLRKSNLTLVEKLLIDAPSKISTVYNRTIKFPTKITNEKLKAETKFELKNPPAGAKIQNKHVVWTPTSEQIGEFELVLHASRQGRTDTHRVSVNVGSPSIELEFSIFGFDVDETGQYALAWGEKLDAGQSNSHPAFGHNTTKPQEVAVIDLEKLRVVVQRRLPAGVKTALLAGKYVFLIPGSGDLLYRFDRNSLGKSKRQFLKSNVAGLFRHDKLHIGVSTHESHNSSLNRVNIQTLELIAPDKKFDNWHSGRGIKHRRIGADLLEGPMAIRRFSDAKIVAAKTRGGIPLLHEYVNSGSGYGGFHPDSNMPNKLFGRYVQGATIRGATRNTIAQFPNLIVGSAYAPIAFGVRVENKRDRNSSTTKLFLDSYNLLDGGAIDSRMIESLRGTNRQRHRSFEQPNLKVLQNEVVLVEKNKIYSLPLIDKQLKKIPMPLHIPWQAIEPLKVDRKQFIDMKALGGTGKIEYALLSEFEGIEIDSSSGRMTIDTPKLWKNFLKKPNATRELMGGGNQNAVTPADWYEKITGESAPENVITCAIQIHVSATDSERQEDRQEFYAFVHAPRAQFDEVISKQKAEQEKQQAEWRAKAEERRREQKLIRDQKLAEQKRLQEQREADNPDSADRFKNLEKRVRRMEATLDSILEKLEKIQNNAGGDK